MEDWNPGCPLPEVAPNLADFVCQSIKIPDMFKFQQRAQLSQIVHNEPCNILVQDMKLENTLFIPFQEGR